MHRRGRPRPTALPAADRQIELARTVKRKLEACGADALAALTLTDWDAFFADTGLAEDTRAPEDAALLTLMLSYPLTLAWLVQEQKRAADVAAERWEDTVVLVDKANGWTSFDVVAKLRGALRQRTGRRKIKVGPLPSAPPAARCPRLAVPCAAMYSWNKR